jgi:hypothetical protein
MMEDFIKGIMVGLLSIDNPDCLPKYINAEKDGQPLHFEIKLTDNQKFNWLYNNHRVINTEILADKWYIYQNGELRIKD